MLNLGYKEYLELINTQMINRCPLELNEEKRISKGATYMASVGRKIKRIKLLFNFESLLNNTKQNTQRIEHILEDILKTTETPESIGIINKKVKRISPIKTMTKGSIIFYYRKWLKALSAIAVGLSMMGLLLWKPSLAIEEYQVDRPQSKPLAHLLKKAAGKYSPEKVYPVIIGGESIV